MPASIEAFIRKKATDFILLAHFSKLVEMGSKEAEKIPLSLSLSRPNGTDGKRGKRLQWNQSLP